MEEKTKARMLLVFFSDGPLERNDCDIGFFLLLVLLLSAS